MRSQLSVISIVLVGLTVPATPFNRTGIVQLFEWKFSDVSKECTEFLGPRGFYGVQISPVNECGVVENRPWYERYQPFSYKIISRSGDENQFKEMVSTCNKAGVRVFVDVVFNHMAADIPNPHGTGGSSADPPAKYYPAVPYNVSNFHATCSIDNYQDASNVRNCELVGLHDLDQSQDYVQGKIIEFLNTLIDTGVAGFRVDAAKHMWPKDLRSIYSKLKMLNTEKGFKPNSKPYIYQEVIDMGGEAVKATEYTDFGSVVDFRYSKEVSRAFKGNNQLKWLRNFGPEWEILPSDVSLAFVDNHDNQRDGDVLTYKQSKQYKMAVGFMMAWPQGDQKRIMSSYDFSNRDQGPPHNPDFTLADVIRNPDLTCSGGWICEHRWRQIYQMVSFSNIVGDAEVKNFWDNGNNQIAFCRGNKGFIAINGDTNDLKQTLQTCLPPGTYCDIISGENLLDHCSGKWVQVKSDGTGEIVITTDEEDGILALHIQSKLKIDKVPEVVQEN